MKRLIYLALSALLIPTATLAQNTSVVIGTTSTIPNGPIYLVDGTGYIAQQVFVWPVGSKHIVEFPFSFDNNGNQLPYQSVANDAIRFTFGGWQANNPSFDQGSNNAVTLTAQSGLTSFIATVSESVQVQIQLNSESQLANSDCSGAPSDAGTGANEGIIYLDGSCIGNPTTLYMALGPHTINAYPYPGWVFYGLSINANAIPGPLSSFTLNEPSVIIPEFSIAKRVNFMTNPPGLQVLVDGATVTTPISPASNGSGSCTPNYTALPPNAPSGFPTLCVGEFDFLPGSTHTIGAPTPQLDNLQNTWVFEQYSNGLGQNGAYVVPNTTTVADTLTAGFVIGVHVTLFTVPAGLKLMIDGRDNWPGYTFIWGQGETHTIDAESPQTVSGRVYNYTSWSDGGAQSHSVVVPTSATGVSIGATYGELSQITFASTPSGLSFTVDGSACTTPCVINKASGATSTVTIPSAVPGQTGIQYAFNSWSDGGSGTTRTVTYGASAATLTASYQTQYLLTLASSPAKGGTFSLNPPSSNGYYAAGTPVTITAAAAQGYKFVEWTGALTGMTNPSSISMFGPYAVTANYISAPLNPTATSVQSAAGPTPSGTVAPGSIISISGQNLAPALMVGPSNPLSQAIGQTTVTVNSFILPLVYVSPNQINAQLPWEIPPGTYTLHVNNTGQLSAPVQFTVASVAPGAFTQSNALQLPLVLAVHQNGTLVTFESPAQQGEQITLYGTGFGPYQQAQIDGFPTSLTDNLVNSLVLNSASGPIPTDSAGAAPGIVGVAAVQVTVGNAFTPGSNMNLTISVNGVNSMPFVLPVQ
jgi:uncharacterized protein (TIGR03437 family)